MGGRGKGKASSNSARRAGRGNGQAQAAAEDEREDEAAGFAQNRRPVSAAVGRVPAPPEPPALSAAAVREDETCDGDNQDHNETDNEIFNPSQLPHSRRAGDHVRRSMDSTESAGSTSTGVWSWDSNGVSLDN